MRKDTLNYIKLLTERDKKTLSQKALKACEEVGELAKVVLPFENAHATNHRFVDRQSILEEVADTYLVVQSIAYELGFSDEDLEEMVKHKSKIWGELQDGEKQYNNKVPYEIHITVSTDDIESFKQSCKDIDVKPIVLDLQDSKGENVMIDVMTSSTFIGNNRGAYEEMKRISDHLKDVAGFEVIREKIETVPYHPAAPSIKQSRLKMPKDCYFESHLGVLCTDKRRKELQRMAEHLHCHLSKNVFKKYDDGTYRIMLTHRNYNTVYEAFKGVVSDIETGLKRAGFDVEKVIVEFSIYDTKVSHDSSWLTKE